MRQAHAAEEQRLARSAEEDRAGYYAQAAARGGFSPAAQAVAAGYDAAAAGRYQQPLGLPAGLGWEPQGGVDPYGAGEPQRGSYPGPPPSHQQQHGAAAGPAGSDSAEPRELGALLVQQSQEELQALAEGINHLAACL